MFRKAQENQDQNKQPVPENRGHQEAGSGGIGNEALAHYLENDLKLNNPNKPKDKKKGRPDPGKAVGTAITLINEIADKDPGAISEIAD